MDDDNRAGRERRKRNIALALVLGGLAVLVYLMSIVQWHGK
jgi:ferric-dicitrate binding protein FerR (iron transport regulator)